MQQLKQILHKLSQTVRTRTHTVIQQKNKKFPCNANSAQCMLLVLTHLHMTAIGPCLSPDVPRPLPIRSITSNMSMTECSGGRSSLGHALKWKRVSLRVWLECWREGRRWQGGEAGHRITLPPQQVSARYCT